MTKYADTTAPDTQTWKIWQQWKGGYFRFDDDNKMGYKPCEIYPFNHLNSNRPVEHMHPIYCQTVIGRTNSILDTLPTGYNRQAFSVLNVCE